MTPADAVAAPTLYRGLAASGGLVFAPVVKFEVQAKRAIPNRLIQPEQVNSEIARFYLALVAARKEIDALAKATHAGASANEAGIFDSHLMMLEDSFFIDTIVKRIRDEHRNVELFVNEELNKLIDSMSAMDDDYMRERMADFVDVRDRLLGLLMGENHQRTLPKISHASIIVADNISPSDAVTLPRRYIRGLVTEQGSLTAHVTILARALGVPAVVGIGQSLDAIKPGDEVALDGYHGQLWLNPTDDIKAALLADTAPQRAVEEHRRTLAGLPAVTPDGLRVTLLANTDQSVGSDTIHEHGAEGIGLYRTEYLWINLGREPTEEEQYRAYTEVLRSCKGQPVTLRVLDIGGDKMVGDSHIMEANPFLGNRSVRYLLNNPQTFRAQVRAILRAAVVGECSMMYPMISTVTELRACKAFVEKCKKELEAEEIPFRRNVPEGVMIEIPAAAIQAESLAKEADFFSIGTNDLVQYTFAVDRGNESVAYLYQPLHLVILTLIDTVVKAAKHHNIPVCVCGEMASDPLAAVLLVGMGIRRLSMSANLIPRIKELICRVAYFDMQRLLDTIHRSGIASAEDVSQAVRAVILKYAPDVLNS